MAVISFATNSLLCRFALKQTQIDAATFSFVRIFSGAAALWLVMKIRRSPEVHVRKTSGNWFSAVVLFVYTAAFSFAYISLSAATGALLLFGAVQATMIFWGLREGERLRAIQVMGVALAFTGLVILLFPGLSTPPLGG